MKLKKQNGFSLIELLIVVAIIGIIAAIAVPNLLSARRSANTASAQQTLRNIHSAQVTYQTSIGQGLFAPGLANLSGNTAADVGFLDVSVTNSANAATPKSGYTLTGYAPVAPGAGNGAGYGVVNQPSSRTGIARTGNDTFFINETGVIRASGSPEADANATSPALNN